MNCAHAQERVVATMWEMAYVRSLDWSIPVNFFSILRFGVHLIVFGEQKTNEMVTFVAKNSGGVTKKPMIILK